MDTRDAIRAEFMRIYERERVDRITVTGLCAAVPAARTTFYAHYRNVDDVLLDVEDGLLAGLADVTERVSSGDLPSMNFAAFLDETFGFIRERWRDFHALLVDQPDTRFVARWKEAVKANFARRHRPLWRGVQGARRRPCAQVQSEACEEVRQRPALAEHRHRVRRDGRGAGGQGRFCTRRHYIHDRVVLHLGGRP